MTYTLGSGHRIVGYIKERRKTQGYHQKSRELGAGSQGLEAMGFE